MSKLFTYVGLSVVLIFAGCGGGDEEPIVIGGGGAASGGGPPAPPATATVTGKITWEGDVPNARAIPTSGDPRCVNPGLRDEAVVVSDGGLENVMVYVSSPVSGSFPTPTTPAVIDQMGCQYKPHALTVMVNQPILFRNSDDTSHNIHASPEVNESFNLSQVRKGSEDTKKFTKPEVMLPIKCDVHSWMNTFVGVFAHPYHTVSTTGGTFEIKLPPGEYEITAHHEKHGKKTGKVTVADNGTAEINFSFSAADKAAD